MNTLATDNITAWPELSSKSLTRIEQLAQYIELDDEKAAILKRVTSLYPMRISPYTASLFDPRDDSCPIRRQFLPSAAELDDPAGQPDPLAEASHTRAGRVIRVYPDRVAAVISARCASYCRFCFRKTLFGSAGNQQVREGERVAALEYIASDRTIRDVLVTGGDPLLLSEPVLERFLKQLRAIKHVEIIRLGTRLLSTWPQRITPALASLLARYHPLWINVHFNHPKELTAQAAQAAATLAEKGIPLNNQSVLLKGVNDDHSTMMELSRRLLRLRIRPYYLFQCHLVSGTSHLRTPIESGLHIMQRMRGHISGLGIPLYTLDTPHGKVPLNPNYLIGREGDQVRVRTYDNQLWDEFNPVAAELNPDSRVGKT